MSGIGLDLFDVGKTVDGLMAKQYLKYFQLQTVQSAENVQITAYGSLKSLFSTLQSKMDSVTNAFNTIYYQASSSNLGVLNASVTSNAVGVGSHSVNVTQLAQAQQYTTQTAFSSKSTGLNIAETLTFTNSSDTTKNFSIAIQSTDSLEKIRDNINNSSSNIGVSAAIVASTDVNGATQYNLILTSNEGSANQITITGDTGNKFDFNQTVSAQDAKFTFDGFNEVRSSNSVTDVMDGLSFNLSALGTAVITTSQNNVDMSSTIQSAVTDMLASYNQIMTFLDGNQYVTVRDDNTKQYTTVLNNSFTFIKSQLQGAVNTIFNGSGGIHSLHDAGIILSPSKQVTDQYDVERTTTSTGSMMIDQTSQTKYNGSNTMSGIIKTDLNSLKDFFTNSSSGFFANVNNVINNNIVTSDGKGLIDNALTSVNNKLESTSQQIGDEKNRLDMVKNNLVDQFSRLNGVISYYQNLGSYLEKQYAYLDNMIRSGK